MLRYDFSVWGNSLPKVSCQCLTYGRPHILEEAIQSFLLQDYPGEKELVILNDHPNTRLILPAQNPQIRIINLSQRVPTIGEKRNLCCESCTGQVILPWDDDDISLPWRISITIQYMQNKQHFKPTKYIKFKQNRITGLQETRVGHNMCGMSKALWSKVRYDHMQSGQDQTIETAFERLGCRYTRPIPDSHLYYIYRWDTGSYHLSAYGWGKGFDQVGAYVEQIPLAGDIVLRPHWKFDYAEMFHQYLKTPPKTKTLPKPTRVIRRLKP